MSAGDYDFHIEQGATFIRDFIWLDSNNDPIPLEDYTARLEIRKNYESSEILLSASTSDGRITITPAAGKVTLTFSDTDTAALTWRYGRYDLELESPLGVVYRLLEGSVVVSKEITRG